MIVVGYYYPGFMAGGILRSVINIVDHLHYHFRFYIITRDRDIGDDRPYPGIIAREWQTVGNATVCYLPPDASSMRELSDIVRRQPHDLIYLNSFFEPLCIRVMINSRIGRDLGKPVVLSPRGEFAWASLQLKYPKKLIFIWVARLTRLFQSAIWHAASAEEAEQIFSVMRVERGGVRVAGDLPTVTSSLDLTSARHHGESGSGRALRVVFLSRVSPEKNLDFALRVLRKVQSRVVFDIIGPLEDRVYWQACERLTKNLPPHIVARYMGTVPPSEVLSILASYDLMLLPSGGESYGHVIAEALTVGTPVLTSTHTPWRNLESRGLGWDLPLDNSAAFVRKIDDLAALDEDARSRWREAIVNDARRLLSDRTAQDAHLRLFREALSSRSGGHSGVSGDRI